MGERNNKKYEPVSIDPRTLKEKEEELVYGSSNKEAVAFSQNAMNIAGYRDEEGKVLEVDGIYGAKTANAVMGYQRANGLPSHGVMDDITWDYMHDDIKRNNYIVPITPIGKYNPRGNAGIVTAYNYEGTSAKTGNTAGTTGTGSYKDNFNGGNSIKPVEIPEAVELYADSPWNESVMEKADFTGDSYSDAGRYNADEKFREVYVESPKETHGIIKPGYNAKGEWSENPDADNYGKDSVKYGLLTVFDNAYEIAGENGNRNAQIAIDVTVGNLRNYDTESITQAYYLIDNQGANWAGHAGLLLVNEDGEGILFSYFRHSDAEGIWNVASDTRIGVFDAETTKKFLGGATIKTPSSSGDICTEQYDGNKQYKISSWQGMRMLQFGINIATSNPEYNLFFRNCDEVAHAMLLVGGIYPNIGIIPNLSYLKKKLNIF